MLWPITPGVTHAPTSLRRPAWSSFLVSSQSILFLSTRSSLVFLNPHDVTGTLSADRGGVRVNCKLEQLIVQLRQDAKFKLASLLRHILHAKSAFGNPNVRFTKLVPLKPYSPDAKAKLARLVEYKRYAPLGTGPSCPASLKRLCPDATTSSCLLYTSPSPRDS